MKVEIQRTELIKPSKPTPQHLRKYKLSVLDQLQQPYYMSIILYYYPVSSSGYDLDSDIARLQKSFSETLTLFYPLAGRYNEEDLSVDCSDQGALFVEAQVSEDLSQLINEDSITGELLSSLLARQVESSASPLVTIQFNTFRCGGRAISFCLTHRITDGFGIYKFIEAFASTACRKGKANISDVNPTSFDLHSVIPARERIDRNPVKDSGKNDVTKFFFFSGEAISNLTAKLVRGQQQKQPSRTVVVSALIWRTLIKLEAAKNDRRRPSVTVHTLNMRGRTGLLPESQNCFGNFCNVAPAKFIPSDQQNKIELLQLVTLIHEAMAQGLKDSEAMKKVDDVSSFTSSFQKVLMEGFDDINGVDMYFFSSMIQFAGFYDSDCGWGKPFWLSPACLHRRVIFLFGSKDGKGIEVWICLEKNDMLWFQQHPDILAFTSRCPVRHHDSVVSRL
ncbi:Vinorine synthase [Melia azedarach]|uniref:Vinorine synthase n=1 Tax=Melia azedarach TaxID=155640 RepID=A0ACC1YLJ7_MELAZ|nr:Vinorine synthase [Melia azedarach]